MEFINATTAATAGPSTTEPINKDLSGPDLVEYEIQSFDQAVPLESSKAVTQGNPTNVSANDVDQSSQTPSRASNRELQNDQAQL